MSIKARKLAGIAEQLRQIARLEITTARHTNLERLRTVCRLLAEAIDAGAFASHTQVRSAYDSFMAIDNRQPSDYYCLWVGIALVILPEMAPHMPALTKDATSFSFPLALQNTSRALADVIDEEASGPDDRPPLVGNALAVYELLLALPSHRCLTGPQIADELAKQSPPIYTDDPSLRKHVFPVLKEHYGLTHYPNRGYCIRA